MVPSEITCTTAANNAWFAKLILSTSKMATRAKQDMHWWKETAFYFIRL